MVLCGHKVHQVLILLPILLCFAHALPNQISSCWCVNSVCTNNWFFWSLFRYRLWEWHCIHFLRHCMAVIASCMDNLLSCAFFVSYMNSQTSGWFPLWSILCVMPWSVCLAEMVRDRRNVAETNFLDVGWLCLAMVPLWCKGFCRWIPIGP